jgi:type IV secretion system protein VirB2
MAWIERKSCARGLTLLGMGLLICLPSAALAAASGMPWEAPLQQILNSISGPVAQTIGVIAIVTFGLAIAFSDGGGLRTACGVVFGLSIAFSAVSFGVSFFGFTGGILRMLGV